jgi:hypothetical protein
MHLRMFDESLAELSEPDTSGPSIGNVTVPTYIMSRPMYV